MVSKSLFDCLVVRVMSFKPTESPREYLVMAALKVVSVSHLTSASETIVAGT